MVEQTSSAISTTSWRHSGWAMMTASGCSVLVRSPLALRSPPLHSDPARTGIDDNNNDDWFQRLQEKWGAYARNQDAHRKDAGAGNMASGLYDHARRRRKDVSAVDGDVNDQLSKAAARAADKQIARANKAAKGKRPKPQRQKDDKAASTRPKPKRRTDDKATSTLPRPPECSRWLREDPPRRAISKLWGTIICEGTET